MNRFYVYENQNCLVNYPVFYAQMPFFDQFSGYYLNQTQRPEILALPVIPPTCPLEERTSTEAMSSSE